MELDAPGLGPDTSLDRDRMAALQRRIAMVASFAEDEGPTPDSLALEEPLDEPALPEELPRTGSAVATTDADPATGVIGADADPDAPLVAGIDQAFLEFDDPERPDEVLSGAVVLRGDAIVATAIAREPQRFPYVPGLLSFREAAAAVAALEAIPLDLELLVLDGSGRLHPRQAGLATHMGVLFDAPAVGVAKRLLCGSPTEPIDEPLPTGTRIAIEADEGIEVVAGTGPGMAADPDWPVLGHAYQSRQYDDADDRHVNPLFVSPGHRTRAGRATDWIAGLCAGYKLPEPTRLADHLAGAAAEELARAEGGGRAEDGAEDGVDDGDADGTDAAPADDA